MLFTSIGAYVYKNYNNKIICFSSACNSEYFNELGITFEPTETAPKISESEMRRIQNKKLFAWGFHRKPQKVCVQYGLLTDSTVTKNIFSKDALEANPALKEKDSVTQIPVWIVTYKGLLGDDYTENNHGSGRRPLDTSTAVIDANSGKLLYSFGASKRYK